jgi:hypothetical protein
MPGQRFVGGKPGEQADQLKQPRVERPGCCALPLRLELAAMQPDALLSVRVHLPRLAATKDAARREQESHKPTTSWMEINSIIEKNVPITKPKWPPKSGLYCA